MVDAVVGSQIAARTDDEITELAETLRMSNKPAAKFATDAIRSLVITIRQLNERQIEGRITAEDRKSLIQSCTRLVDLLERAGAMTLRSGKAEL